MEEMERLANLLINSFKESANNYRMTGRMKANECKEGGIYDLAMADAYEQAGKRVHEYAEVARNSVAHRES